MSLLLMLMGKESTKTDQGAYKLHLVAAKVLVVQAFQPFTHFVAGYAIGRGGCLLRGFQDVIFHEDGAVHSQGQRQSIIMPGIYADNSALALPPAHRNKRVFLA